MRAFIVYLLVLFFFALGICLAFEQGQKLSALQTSASARPAKAAAAQGLLGTEPSSSLFSTLGKNLQDPLPRLFLQLIVILLAARLAGVLAAKLRQPAVIGEMIAGILLGP